MVSHILRRDPTYPKQVSKGEGELKSRYLPLLKLLDDSQDSLLLKMLSSLTSLQVLAQASPFSLKRENPAHFKNSDLTLSLKRGSYNLYNFRVPLLAQARQLSLRRDNSRSGGTTLTQARQLSLKRDNSLSGENPSSISLARDKQTIYVEIKTGDHIIPQVTRFSYLESIIQDDEKIDKDVNHMIQASWMKWQSASSVIYDKNLHSSLMRSFTAQL
ncbi:hypothetical protein Lal_00021492 [Lupinus albus]|nr:hypothetical protein Lal_00021492 [Lupinus albus]